MKNEFSHQIFEISSNIKFHEIRPVGVECVHAEPYTMKLTVAFWNFANIPKKGV